jgi:hypothetical protein
MKRTVSLLLLVLLVTTATWAISDKYQIFSERKGWLGLGGKTIIMLDRENGDSWRLEDNKWVEMPRITQEALQAEQVTPPKPSPEDEAIRKAKIESVMNELKSKQDAEMKAFQEKQTEEMKSLADKLNNPDKLNNNPAPVAEKENKPVIQTAIRRTRVVAAKKEAPVSKDKGNEEGPPAWLTE